MIELLDMKVAEILDKLKVRFPDSKSELNFENNFQLLIAVILSAQCTDKRVNMLTPALFQKFPTPYDYLSLVEEDIIPYIKSAGFYNNKAKSIILTAKDIVNRFGGSVPSDFESLLTLRGVGRKTASVVYAVGFSGNAIAVDTHVFRVSNRLGIAKGKTPNAVEEGLKGVIDEKDWGEAHHLLLFLGRYICKARKPECGDCPLTSNCEYFASEMQEINLRKKNEQII